MGRASRAKRGRNHIRSLWHFTSRWHLVRIMETGFLNLTDSNRFPRSSTPGEVVWLMEGADLGPVSHGLEGSATNKREARIEVPANLGLRWQEWLKTVPHDVGWQEALIASGGGAEAAQRWHVATSPIPAAAWLRVEVRTADGSWKEVRNTA